jgi:hypothetical protein
VPIGAGCDFVDDIDHEVPADVVMRWLQESNIDKHLIALFHPE